jgi:hypothetical protein
MDPVVVYACKLDLRVLDWRRCRISMFDFEAALHSRMPSVYEYIGLSSSSNSRNLFPVNIVDLLSSFFQVQLDFSWFSGSAGFFMVFMFFPPYQPSIKLCAQAFHFGLSGTAIFCTVEQD